MAAHPKPSKKKKKKERAFGPRLSINDEPKTLFRSHSNANLAVNVSSSGVASNKRTSEFFNASSKDTTRSNAQRLSSAKIGVIHMIAAAMGRAPETKKLEKEMTARRKKRDKSVNKSSRRGGR